MGPFWSVRPAQPLARSDSPLNFHFGHGYRNGTSVTSASAGQFVGRSDGRPSGERLSTLLGQFVHTITTGGQANYATQHANLTARYNLALAVPYLFMCSGQLFALADELGPAAEAAESLISAARSCEPQSRAEIAGRNRGPKSLAEILSSGDFAAQVLQIGSAARSTHETSHFVWRRILASRPADPDTIEIAEICRTERARVFSFVALVLRFVALVLRFRMRWPVESEQTEIECIN